MIEQLLDTALSGKITQEVALAILEESRQPDCALKLFQAASMLRDQTIGKDLWWSAGIARLLPCKVIPRCTYCTYFTNEAFPLNKLLATIKKIEALGLKQIHLSGGTNLDGYDHEIISILNAIRTVSDITIEVNLGPSFSAETVKTLKKMGVRSITSSLETFNDKLFRKAKPGDSLEKRKNLLELCNNEGLSVRSMMLIGLGETYEDRIRHLFYLKGLSCLYHLRFSRFYPYQGTSYSKYPRCSSWELARTVAVARLIMPHVELGLAMGNSTDDIPLWYLAGGGNQLLGITVSRKSVKPEPGQQIIPVADDVFIVNSMPAQQQYVEGMGRRIIFECPEK